MELDKRTLKFLEEQTKWFNKEEKKKIWHEYQRIYREHYDAEPVSFRKHNQGLRAANNYVRTL